MPDTDELVQRKVQVPWIFLDEWKKVYEAIYSQDIERRKRGHEKLMLWKARQTRLPAGVECTLELIHVLIIDQEVTQQISNGKRPMYAENDLQLMCSAAVMRFLNHVSNIAQTSDDSLYRTADKLNIPNWIVMLRHNSAHSINLPSLGVLRMAVNFAFEWLHDNYWNVASAVPSMVISKTTRYSDQRVGELLDIWQSIKMYQMNSYVYIDEVPDEDLQRLVMNLLKKKDEENIEERILENEYTRQLSYSIKRVMSKLFNVIKVDRSKTEKLLGLLLESETFIPPARYITGSKEDLTHESISLWLGLFWKDFLIPFQRDFNLFPSLVHKLILLLNVEECKHRQLVMALWIKLLCVSMLKSQEIMAAVYKLSGNKIQASTSFRKMGASTLKSNVHIPRGIIADVEKNKPHLKNVFFVPSYDPKGNSCPVADIKLAVLNPNELTEIFLSSLLAVANPEIPETSKQLLEELVSIWMKPSDLSIDVTDNIHTLNDLFKTHGKEVSETKILEENETLKTDEHDVSTYNWSTCPLGLLPWQKETEIVLDIPSDVTWQLTEDIVKAKNKHNPAFQVMLSKKKVNWHTISKSNSVARAKLKSRKAMQRKLKKIAPLCSQQF